MCLIRDYRPGDEDDVFQIVKQVLPEYGLSTDSMTTDSDLRDINDSYLSNGGVFRIVESNGKAVGSYGLYVTTPHSCELRKMYLLPEFRGRGLGKRMIEDALREAGARGFSEMTLETNSCLKEAVCLYKSYGFVEIEPEHLAARCDLAMKKIFQGRP